MIPLHEPIWGLSLLTGALVLDRAIGEYPAIVHPVVWTGQAIQLAVACAPHTGRAMPLVAGGLIALGIPAAAAGIGVLVVLLQIPLAVAWVIQVLLLKSTFASRALASAALPVRDGVAENDLPRARAGLRSLCSRDPSDLSAPDLVGATVSSIAENASDSIVAPLLFFALGGLPAALAYRAVNTLDAMVGYRTGRYEYLGKPSARLDDLLNLIPARVTALLFAISGMLHRLPVGRGIHIWRRDARLTPSPNGGHPMAMVAGTLGIQLRKPDVYTLGDAIETPALVHVDQAIRLLKTLTLLAAGCITGLFGVLHATL